MRFSAKFAGALVGLAGAGLAGAGLLVAPVAAQAAPSVDVDEVVGALGLASEPADYVVVVDTSGSMNQDARYPKVRTQLRTLLSGLDSDDRVSLLTFDSTVVKRYRGAVGTSPEAILAHLPATASGVHTDIGAAIDGGLAQLERTDTHRLAALILITDGVKDTLPTAKYAKVDSANWDKLKVRAAGLAKNHELAAYAVSLIATTDAGLLKKAVPQATEVGADEVGTRFEQVAGDLVRLQAAEALEEELASPIKVVLTGELGTALADGKPVPLQLDISSPYPHVPIVLSELSLQASDGLHLMVSGLPETISLEPGETATVQAQVSVTGSGGSGAAVSLAAKVSSPWRKVLEKDLGLKFAPPMEGTAVVPAAPLKLPPALVPVVGVIAGILAVGLGLLLLVRTVLTPKIDGLVSVSRHGRLLADVVITGRRGKLVAPGSVTELAGLSGSVVGARGPGKGQRAVRLVARLGKEKAQGLVSDGDVIQMGDMEICYITGRRRILDKIGLPTESFAER